MKNLVPLLSAGIGNQTFDEKLGRQEISDARADFAQVEMSPFTSRNFCHTSRITKGNRVQKGWKAQTVLVCKCNAKGLELIKENDPTLPNIEFDKHNRCIRERIIDQAQRYHVPFM